MPETLSPYRVEVLVLDVKDLEARLNELHTEGWKVHTLYPIVARHTVTGQPHQGTFVLLERRPPTLYPAHTARN